MLPVGPVLLADDVVRLEPLSADHVAALHEAASADRSTYGLTIVPASLEAWRTYVDGFLAEQARGTTVPLATCDARTGRVVGSTRFMTSGARRAPRNPPIKRPQSGFSTTSTSFDARSGR